MKVVQINTVANTGSTGRIAEEIGKKAIARGWESYIAYGRGTPRSESHLIKIGSEWDMRWHGLETRLLDNHGLSSRRATREFVKQLEKIKPDVVHLHNIHGYYLNYKILFQYLADNDIPVVWTLHDCWSFTGHCSHFIYTKCDKWKTGCANCAQKHGYPGAMLLSRSEKNYRDKARYFTMPRRVVITPASQWIASLLKDSFLKNHTIHCVNNGVDLKQFAPAEDMAQLRQRMGIDPSKHLVLGVSSVWNAQKGINDFHQLRECLPEDYDMVLVGLPQEMIDALPQGIRGLGRTRNAYELADWYRIADVFANPTHADTFPTVNMEALACGTPVVTYSGTGGSAEQVDQKTGRVVAENDIKAFADAIMEIVSLPEMRADCRKRAEALYNKDDRFNEYVDIYEELTRK